MFFKNSILEKWVSSVDLSKTRILRFPSFIFLCGGPISKENNKYCSCRDIFYKYVKENNFKFKENIVLAEEIFRYFDHSDYKDLLCFESDIAELSILTIIFSESPGSIAELGSFSVLKTVKERLIVVMHTEDAYKESFIWRGPALNLINLAKEMGKENPISVYDWRRSTADVTGLLNKDDFTDVEDLTEIIINILSKTPKTTTFDKKRIGHNMILMIEILNIIQLATLDDLIDSLNLFNIEYDKNSLAQHLSLLISLKMIEKHPYRNNIFYLASPSKPWISWAFKKTAEIRDTNRWVSLFTEYYTIHQKHKSRALRSYIKNNISRKI